MHGGRDGLRIDIHRRPQRGMPHQFLHHFEFGSDASEKRGIGMPEGMPADALLNFESRGNRPDVMGAPAFCALTDKPHRVAVKEFVAAGMIKQDG
jgi:hypothetical protein